MMDGWVSARGQAERGVVGAVKHPLEELGL